jgi:low density lipoprotein receptor-related protein 5/6
MYWSDWGSHPKLERAWLDGTHREVLVNTSIQWPNGLALDYIERKVYWADAKLDKIEVCNLNGSGRRVVLDKEVPHIYGFGLIGKHLYWTDWQRRNLQRIHVDSSHKRDIIAELLPAVMGLKVVDMRLKYGKYTINRELFHCEFLPVAAVKMEWLAIFSLANLR